MAHYGPLPLIIIAHLLLLDLDACVAQIVLVALIQIVIVHTHFLIRDAGHVAGLDRLRVQVGRVVRPRPHAVSPALAPVRTDLPRVLLRLVARVGLLLLILNEAVVHVVARVQAVHQIHLHYGLPILGVRVRVHLLLVQEVLAVLDQLAVRGVLAILLEAYLGAAALALGSGLGLSLLLLV